MASRVFDTYMPGSVEPLVSFINSLSDGRILCLAILVSNIIKSKVGKFGSLAFCVCNGRIRTIISLKYLKSVERLRIHV